MRLDVDLRTRIATDGLPPRHVASNFRHRALQQGPRARVLITIGTRPEAIKLAPLILGLRDSDVALPIVATTGQHRAVVDEILSDFGIGADRSGCSGSRDHTLHELSGRCLKTMAAIITEVEPDLVMVQGDTTSALMSALASFYENIPVWHVEAGLRTSNPRLPFPEEMNRRLIAQLSDRHFAPTLGARRNLEREGIEPERICVSGNTGIDAFQHAHSSEIELPGKELAEFVAGTDQLMVVTSHRRENWGSAIESIATGIARTLECLPRARAVYVTHPNPAIGRLVDRHLGESERAMVTPPLRYHHFVRLVSSARLLITDSGGIQEEAPSLGIPVLVTRDATERPEGVRAGVAHVVGVDPGALVHAATRLLTEPRSAAGRPNPYGDGRAADRIVAHVEAFAAGQRRERRSTRGHPGLRPDRLKATGMGDAAEVANL